jgi:hypothetical protein
MANAPLVLNDGVKLGNNETLAIYDEGTWTPTITAGTGTPTTVAASNARYTRVGNRVDFSLEITITNKGDASGEIITTLPFTPANKAVANCVETVVAGSQGKGYIYPPTSRCYISRYDYTTMWVNNYSVLVSGTYFI